MPEYSFKKQERLNSRKVISRMFEEGKSIHFFPLRILYLKKPQNDVPATMAVVIPKRLIKKAVHRNLLKRRIRESYRLYKPEFRGLLEKSSKQYYLIIIYQSEKIENSDVIDVQLKKALNKLSEK